MTIAEGETAPEFDLPATGKRRLSLDSYKGKPFILYFYPKADTPGCTKEACAFQKEKPHLEELGLEVVGVSPDKIKPIERFVAKYGLTYSMASDEGHVMADRYGAWVEKSMYGRKYMGMERCTFLIGSNGRVLKVWRKVNVTGHAEDVVKAARAAKLV
jgi:peroxiredoxin Q/BCP